MVLYYCAAQYNTHFYKGEVFEAKWGREVYYFFLGDMLFEYDPNKNKKNIEKHGISFRSAARVFFDYDRLEFYDEENSEDGDRYNTIGDISFGLTKVKDNDATIGLVGKDDIIFVVYTERIEKRKKGIEETVTRLISARYVTNFERGLYYGKY